MLVRFFTAEQNSFRPGFPRQTETGSIPQNLQIQMSVGHVGNPFAPEGLYEIWAKVKLVGEDENHRPLEVGIDRIVILPPVKE